jgi:hypothetical protein
MAAPKRPPNVVTTLPSGVVVEFWDETGVDGLPQQRRYSYDGQKLVSISTVANVYDKPALPGWAAKVTVEGVSRLLDVFGPEALYSPERIRELLRDQGLDHDSVRDQAAERGTAAHDAFLHLLRDGKIPTLSEYPEEWRPYIQAGVRFVLDEEPEVIDCEQIVASVEHGFAGRYDLFARFPKREGRTGRVDFKTVTEWKYGRPRKDGSCDLLPPYPEHVSQTEGYEIAAVESGMEPSDFRGVVRLGPDGEYDFTESWAEPQHFLGDLASYRNRQALNAAGAEKRKAEKKAREVVAA